MIGGADDAFLRHALDTPLHPPRRRPGSICPTLARLKHGSRPSSGWMASATTSGSKDRSFQYLLRRRRRLPPPCARHPSPSTPAKAGVHLSNARAVEAWVPTFVGMDGIGDNVRFKDRSFQYLLSRSIKLIFQSRFHSLICFSRRNAASLDVCASNQTSRLTRYRLVKPGTTLFLCSQMRRRRSDVIPV